MRKIDSTKDPKIHFDVYCKKGKIYITNDNDDCFIELTTEECVDLACKLSKALTKCETNEEH